MLPCGWMACDGEAAWQNVSIRVRVIIEDSRPLAGISTLALFAWRKSAGYCTGDLNGRLPGASMKTDKTDTTVCSVVDKHLTDEAGPTLPSTAAVHRKTLAKGESSRRRRPERGAAPSWRRRRCPAARAVRRPVLLARSHQCRDWRESPSIPAVVAKRSESLPSLSGLSGHRRRNAPPSFMRLWRARAIAATFFSFFFPFSFWFSPVRQFPSVAASCQQGSGGASPLGYPIRDESTGAPAPSLTCSVPVHCPVIPQ